MSTILGGRYRLLAVLGAGGMGEVWRAHDDVLQRDVAVKVIRPHLADSDDVRARLRTEARLAGSLHHPHIVDVFDFGEDEQDGHPLPYVVMPLVEGEPLSSVVADRSTLSAGETMAVVRDVATALQAAHDQGIVHRDLKPGNIWLTPDGRAMLMDFGIARSAGDEPLTRTGTLIGTADYLSPEQASGRSVTGASDLYGLGVVAYVCLTGAPPFHRENDVATALAHLQAEVPPLPETVPPGVAELVLRLLAKDPTDRPASAEELAGAAGAFATSVPTPTGASPALDGPETVLDPEARPGATMPGIVERAVTPGPAAAATTEVPAPSVDTQRSPTPATSPVPPAAATSVVAEHHRRSPRRMVVLGSALAAVVALLGAWMVMSGSDDVTVPDLRGRSAAAATAALEDLGLTVRVDEVDRRGGKAGEVLGQDPAAGTEVAGDATVNLEVASGFVRVPTDDLEGASYDDAARRLDRLGLKASRVDVAAPEPAGTVVGVDPEDRAKIGSTVELSVSNGLGAAAPTADAPEPEDTGSSKGGKEPKAPKPRGKKTTTEPEPSDPAPTPSTTTTGP